MRNWPVVGYVCLPVIEDVEGGTRAEFGIRHGLEQRARGEAGEQGPGDREGHGASTRHGADFSALG
jgi:hypothetical protein